jgi:hypothetical protein
VKELHIRPVLNGFVVKIGCQEVVFTSVKDFIKEFTRYQEKSDEVEKEYVKNALNKVGIPTPPAGEARPMSVTEYNVMMAQQQALTQARANALGFLAER